MVTEINLTDACNTFFFISDIATYRHLIDWWAFTAFQPMWVIYHWVDTWWANGAVSPSNVSVVDRLDL